KRLAPRPFPGTGPAYLRSVRTQRRVSMTNERSGSGQDKHTDTDILKRSFERETDGQQHEANRDAAGEKHRRSVLGAPVDPNSPTTKGGFPPGVPPEDVVEP